MEDNLEKYIERKNEIETFLLETKAKLKKIKIRKLIFGKDKMRVLLFGEALYVYEKLFENDVDKYINAYKEDNITFDDYQKLKDILYKWQDLNEKNLLSLGITEKLSIYDMIDFCIDKKESIQLLNYKQFHPRVIKKFFKLIDRIKVKEKYNVEDYINIKSLYDFMNKKMKEDKI